MEARTTQPNTHPSASQRVNRTELPLSEVDPHSVKQKAAQDKLQLLGTIQAMQRDGRMPHNDHISELLDKLKTNKVISSREHTMSSDGQKLLHDFRELIQTVQRALAVKNKDELFQSLVYHLHCMESPVKKEHITSTVKSHHNKSEVQSEGKKASDAMFKIGKLILINNEFRSVLGELIDISQDIFNSVTGKIGDSLQQAGSGLQDNNNTDKSGKYLVDKALDSALNSKDQDAQSRQHEHTSYHDHEPHLISGPQADPRHQDLLSTGDSVHPNVIPGRFTDVNTAGHQEPGSSLEHSSIPHQQGTGFIIKDASNPPHGQGIDSQTSRRMSEQTPQNLKEKALNHPMYHNAREEANEHKQHVQETVKENIPKEKQDELVRRLQRATAEVQKHPDYQDAINTLIRLVKIWSSRLTKVSEGAMSQAKQNDKPEQMSYREDAERELKAIIECWAQDQSIDPLLHGVQDVMRDMQNDQQLREYYHSVIKYVDRLVREPGYASQDQATEEGQQLMNQGNHIVKGQYSDHLNYLSSESRKLMNLMAEDEVFKELHARIATIHRDLWMDSEGNPAFKPHFLNDMRMTLLPAFIDEIKYIPIPRIEYSDRQFDIVIENLILSGDAPLPNVFDTKIESFNSVSLRSTTESKPSHQSMFIRMSEIQAEIDDVVFFYKKKTGFPKISDRGVASLSVGGKGITVSVRVSNVTDNPAKTFKVAYCKCHVDNLKVKVNDSNHDILYKAIRPLVIGQIRKQVAKGIELKVTELLNQADQKLTNTIINMNQSLQNKAYDALPEQDKAGTRPPSLSPARSRPGFFSTMAAIMNRNIKTKIQQRNENKRLSQASDSRPSSQHLDNEKRQVSDSTHHNIPHTGGIQHSTQHGLGTQEQHHGAASGVQHPTQQGFSAQEHQRGRAGGVQHPTQQGFGIQEQYHGSTGGFQRPSQQGLGTEEQHYGTAGSVQKPLPQKPQTNNPVNQGFDTPEQHQDPTYGAQQPLHKQQQPLNQGFGTQEYHSASAGGIQHSLYEQQQTYNPVNQGFGSQGQHFGTAGGVQHSLHEPQQTYNTVNPSTYNAQPGYAPSNTASMVTDQHHSIASPPLSPVKKEFDVPAQKQATDNMANLTNVDITQH